MEPEPLAFERASAWQRVLDSVSDAVITTDANFIVRGWSRAATAIYGWTQAEALGVPVGDRVRQLWESEQHRQDAIDQLTREGSWRGHVVHRTKDGLLRHIMASVTWLTNDQGERTGVVAVNRDVTAERAASEVVAQAQDRIAVAQRTEALARLSASVAHDFNNLLAKVAAHAELAGSRHQDPGVVTACLRDIQAVVGRGQELTRQFLSFGRTDKLEVANEDLADVVRGIEGQLRTLLGDGLHLGLVLHPARAEVCRGEIEHALVNVCANARDAAHSSGRVIVRTHDDGDEVLVEVEDDGEGMGEEVRVRALEPFFSTRPPHEGAGLGLAVVDRIATRTGGRVEIRSRLGHGTCVTLRFPKATASPAPEQRLAQRPLQILVAEDDDALRDILCSLLRLRGHEVTGVADGLAAVDSSRASAFDVLITDVSMPRMSGPEAAAQMRAESPALPVIYLSGYPGADVANWPRGVFVRKPTTLAELTDAIERARSQVPAG